MSLQLQLIRSSWDTSGKPDSPSPSHVCCTRSLNEADCTFYISRNRMIFAHLVTCLLQIRCRKAKCLEFIIPLLSTPYLIHRLCNCTLNITESGPTIPVRVASPPSNMGVTSDWVQILRKWLLPKSEIIVDHCIDKRRNLYQTSFQRMQNI